MKRSLLFLQLISAFPLLLLSAEPSAFGAGDLNNPKPYGLTSNEKVILETKDSLHKVAVKSNNQANELDSLRERVDGFQGIIESLSRKAHNNKVNLQKVVESNSLNLLSTQEYEKRLGTLVQSNSDNIEKLKTLTSEMSTLLDSINTHYVSKDEFNALVNDVNNFKALVAKELDGKSKSSSKANSTSLESSDVYNQAKIDFDKKNYTKAIESYEYLIKQNYKPAYAHYMIGEMNYMRKNYSAAISYFKKSSSLYSKASYMPSLMLHSAISMDKTGDSAHANAFYEAILSKYPDSTEAKYARKNLNK
jgi:TolA-binding protein